MKRVRTFFLIAAGYMALGVSFAQEQGPQEPKIVDFEADVMRPVKIGDSSALSLVGHVVFYHNGAVITCDSAVRYSDRMMDCFRNVIINKDSVYAYGDRLEYNGNIDMATVYAPLVKMVDKDATLYCYSFSFDTRNNIGRYSGGGTMRQGDNLLESDRGYYYADTRELIGVGNVELSNAEYTAQSDSVGYRMDSEVASFYTRSYIWNSRDQFLTARRGDYDRKNEQYTFTDDSYILTENQEVWADTILYRQALEEAVLLRNVQIADQEQQAMAFGDYARYWGNERKALLTNDPSVLSFNDGPDTLYMRADSVWLFTVNRFEKDTLSSVAVDSSGGQKASPVVRRAGMSADSLAAVRSALNTPHAGERADSVATDGNRTEIASEKEDGDEQAEPGDARAAKRAEKQRLKALKREAKEARRRQKRAQERPVADTVSAELPAADSIAAVWADSMPALPQVSPVPTEKDVPATDSLVRVVRAYYDVKMYRSDFQAVCDSLVGFSADSTLHLYTKPVMWNENNQITAETIDVYTKNQKIDKAVFIGDPIMSAEVDTLHYNQVKGRVIDAYFRDGAIVRIDALGNGQTYYYTEDGDSTDRYVTGFMTVTCADISFYFEDQQLDRITWRGEPDYSIFPIDKIPGSQSLFLKGFVWDRQRRPRKSEVFDRNVRGSMRQEYENLPKPDYPITRRIEEDKKRLSEEGVWVDRNDVISEDALEFIRSLEY